MVLAAFPAYAQCSRVGAKKMFIADATFTMNAVAWPLEKVAGDRCR